MDHLLSLASILATATSLLANQAVPVTYTHGSTGYDVSFPQCGGGYPAGAFGIVGVNGGYPFVHYNPCLADEVAHSPHAALYINTGYDPLYTQVDVQHTIVGSLPVTGDRANWVATGNLAAEGARARCGTGFSGASVWLVQYIEGGFDTNYAC